MFFVNIKVFINICNIYEFLVIYIGKKCYLIYIYIVILDIE